MPVYPVSTVPAAIAYLVGAIKAQIANDPLPIEISVGQEGADMPPDIIVFGEVRREPGLLALVGSGGQYFLEEKYDLMLIASTWTGSGVDSWDSTQQLALVDRAWQLTAYVETASRLDPSMGQLVNLSNPSLSGSANPEVTYDGEGNATGMKCEVGLSIHVEVTL